MNKDKDFLNKLFCRTNIGRSRAWVRLSLMQKLLAEQVQAMIEDKEHLR